MAFEISWDGRTFEVSDQFLTVQRHGRHGALRQAAIEIGGRIDDAAVAVELQQKRMIVLIHPEAGCIDVIVPIGQYVRLGGDQTFDVGVAILNRDIDTARRIEHRIEQGGAARDEAAESTQLTPSVEVA